MLPSGLCFFKTIMYQASQNQEKIVKDVHTIPLYCSCRMSESDPIFQCKNSRTGTIKTAKRSSRDVPKSKRPELANTKISGYDRIFESPSGWYFRWLELRGMWVQETRSACLSIYLTAVTNLHCSLVDKMPVRNIHVATID